MSNIKAVVEVNNIPFTGFQSITVTRSIETGSGTFQISATKKEGQKFPIKNGSKIVIKLAGHTVITGFIEKRSGRADSNSNIISLAGRGKIQDVIDCSLQGDQTFTGSTSLKTIIERVIKDVGIDIQVIDGSGGIEDFDGQEIEATESDTKAFAFIEKLAKKRQVLITTNGEGNIVITRGLGRHIDTHLIHIENGKNNNVKEATLDEDHSNRFHKYIVKSADNPSADSGGGVKDPKVATNREGISIDNEIRKSRTLVINAESASDNQTSTERAVWKQNFERAKSKTYTATVAGFLAEKDGKVWEPNFLVNINDDVVEEGGIRAQMLIKSVTYNLSNEGGATTTLEFVVKDAYRLQAEQDAIEANANKIGGV
jgi:prophage tail gpP-like protein